MNIINWLWILFVAVLLSGAATAVNVSNESSDDLPHHIIDDAKEMKEFKKRMAKKIREKRVNASLFSDKVKEHKQKVRDYKEFGKKFKKKKQKLAWIIDESKCLSMTEIRRLRKACCEAKTYGLRNNRFCQIRNWFMVELALNVGLRVEEMASIQHTNFNIEGEKSSIVVVGKGNKKRAVWISSEFKKKYRLFLRYKTKFGFSIDDESYLFNNLHGNKITKRALQKFFKNIITKKRITESLPHSLSQTYLCHLFINVEQLQLPICSTTIGTRTLFCGDGYLVMN